MKIIRLAVCFLFIIHFPINAYCRDSKLLHAKGIVILELKMNKNLDNKTYALSNSWLIIDSQKYILGDKEIFLYANVFLNSFFADSILNEIYQDTDKSDIFNTRYFRDSSNLNHVYGEINFGGQTFISENLNNENIPNSFFIAYEVKGDFFSIDSNIVNKIYVKKIHCYEPSKKNYPIIIPLKIKKWHKLRNKQINRLEFKKHKFAYYYFQNCD